MKVKFNFNLEAWIQDVEIEAGSMEEAKNKLYGMTVQELIEAGYIHTSDLDDVEGEIVEKTIKVKVYDIEYDIEEDAFDDFEEYNELINSLPSVLTLDVLVSAADNEENMIADEITYETNYPVLDFKYLLISEY